MALAQATPHPAVVFMPEGSRTHMGGTMRLGARRTLLQTVDCISAKLYQVPRCIRLCESLHWTCTAATLSPASAASDCAAAKAGCG